MPGAQSARTKARVDRLSVMLFAASWILALAHLGPGLAAVASRAFASLSAAPLLIAGLWMAALAAYLLADFLAGAVHWLADRCFDPSTPILGPMLISPFREHHTDPKSITRHDFFEVTGNNALVSTPVVLALLWLPSPDTMAAAFVATFGLSLTLALVATNQFHGWAHADSPPAFARALHRAGLILTPERHAQHHRGGHDRAYCVTSGWLNPLLDRSRLFDRIEKGLSNLAGAQPTAKRR